LILFLLRHSSRTAFRHFHWIALAALAVGWAFGSFGENQPAAAQKQADREEIRAKKASKPNNPPQAIFANKATFPEAETEDERFRRLALGTWEDHYHGKRTMILREDGTATMVVELEGLGATLFAKKLTFDIEWRIEEGVLYLKTIGGAPKKKIALASRLYGDEAEEYILDLTEERFLVEHDEDTDFEWTRVKSAE